MSRLKLSKKATIQFRQNLKNDNSSNFPFGIASGEDDCGSRTATAELSDGRSNGINRKTFYRNCEWTSRSLPGAASFDERSLIGILRGAVLNWGKPAKCGG
jgi:hypothetical protein